MESGRPECLVLGLSGGLSLHFAVISFWHLSQKIGVPGGQVVGGFQNIGLWGAKFLQTGPVGAQRHNKNF